MCGANNVSRPQLGNRRTLKAFRLSGREHNVVLRIERELAMKKLLVVLALSSGLLVSACNTLHGAADDVKSVGDCADGRPGNC